MTTGQIVAIVVLVLLVALIVAAVLLRKRSPNVRKAEAAQHRLEAEQRRASAERLEAEAAERAERARAEHAQATKLAEMAAHDREVAQKAAAQADRLDPDHAGHIEHTGHTEHGDRPAALDRPATGDRSPASRPDPDRAPRHTDYDPEPIVGGAAEGMITPRRSRSAPEPATEPATGSAPTGSSADETRPHRTVGDAVREREGAARPADAGPAAEGRPSLADRIMGRA